MTTTPAAHRRRRRLAAIGLVAAAAMTGGLVAAGTVSAAPKPHRPHAAKAVNSVLPAPPRPPRQPAHRIGTRSSAVATATAAPDQQRTTLASGLSAATAAATGPTNTLVLYDNGGTWGWLGELYAQQTANLVSHFGTWKAEPVSGYTPGRMSGYSAVVYIGSTYDQPLPAAFLTDVKAGSTPVIWMYDNIWQLTNSTSTFTADYGWNWTQFDFSNVPAVTYKGTNLTRDSANNASGIMNITAVDPAKATVLATSNRSDGTSFPWAVRSRNLTYIGEIPYTYSGMTDRYLALSDLLFDTLAPATTTRRRAMVRIEDVGPDASPTELRAVADALYARGVPFSVAVYPQYKDPNGTYNNGVATSIRLRDKPSVVSALKYMVSKGGTLLMHGYTHQFSNQLNPYSGASADDFEFFTAHVDSANFVRLDGPVPGDSTSWANSRMTSSAAEFTASGLAVPTIFEFPHYAGSAVDYAAVGARFATRYERGLYFGGLLSGGPVNYSHVNGQFFPYPVKDLYGTKVLPENIGNEEPEVYNNNPIRLPADIIAAAKANLVVRDGFASFFYHPYLGAADLVTIVNGIKNLGYTFVRPGSVTLP